jgi:hypothetical protein
VNILSRRVDKLAVKTLEARAKSMNDLDQIHNQDQDIMAGAVEETAGGSRTCHKCHCPISDPYHAGVQAGLEKCTLDHWSGCSGDKPDGKDSSGRVWKSCPLSDQFSDKDSKQTLDSEKSGSSFPTTVKEAVDMMAKYNKEDRVSISSSDSSDSDGEEIRIRREELEKLKQDLAKKAKEKKKAEKREKKKLELEQLDKERIALLGQAKSLLTQENENASSSLKQKAAQHAANQQKLAEQRQNSIQVLGLTMPQIRSMPGMTPQVEQFLSTKKNTRLPSITEHGDMFDIYLKIAGYDN